MWDARAVYIRSPITEFIIVVRTPAGTWHPIRHHVVHVFCLSYKMQRCLTHTGWLTGETHVAVILVHMISQIYLQDRRWKSVSISIRISTN